jgi:hypothetical protein
MGSLEDEQTGSRAAAQESAGQDRLRRSITVSVVAYVNLTRQEGAIAFVRPVPDFTATTPPVDSPIALRTTIQDTTIAEYPARLLLNRKINAHDDETGIVDVLIPVDVGAAIQLVLNGAVIDTFDPCRRPD